MDSARSDDAAAAEHEFFARRGCCCFCLGGGGKVWERIGGGGGEDHWWMKPLLKLREWSELLAGPRWKTFIRRCGRGFVGGGGGGGVIRRGKFQYDPLSYARNFDEDGHGNCESDENSGFPYPDFSSRFAVPPASAKSSMDLGGKDAPPLFPSTQPIPAVAAN